MISWVSQCFEKCCPWLKSEKSISKYQQKISENENEFFVKENTLSDHHSEGKDKQIYALTPSDSLVKAAHSKLHSRHNEHEMMPASSSRVGSLLDFKSEVSDYSQCISDSHPYYQLLSSKINLLPGIFELGVPAEQKVAENDYGLKIYIKQSQDEKTNIFVYTFTFPTSFESYEQLQNNFELQKSFDTNISNYECKEKIDDSTKIIYLAYKKVLIVSPRDFVYVRYRFNKGPEYWSVATSLPDEQPYEGKVRGSIILTATKAVQKEGKLEISVYSQVDMKMPIKASAARARGITEIKKYLDKCYCQVQLQQNSIL